MSHRQRLIALDQQDMDAQHIHHAAETPTPKAVSPAALHAPMSGRQGQTIRRHVASQLAQRFGNQRLMRQLASDPSDLQRADPNQTMDFSGSKPFKMSDMVWQQRHGHLSADEQIAMGELQGHVGTTATQVDAAKVGLKQVSEQVNQASSSAAQSMTLATQVVGMSADKASNQASRVASQITQDKQE